MTIIAYFFWLHFFMGVMEGGFFLCAHKGSASPPAPMAVFHGGRSQSDRHEKCHRSRPRIGNNHGAQWTSTVHADRQTPQWVMEVGVISAHTKVTPRRVGN